MSSHLGDQREAPRNVFRGADGNELLLDQDSHTNPNTSGILKFVLHNNSRSHLRANLAILFVTLLLWLSRFPSTLIIFLLAVLIFRVKLMVAAVRSETLIVVESVGVQLVSQSFLNIFKKKRFIPWFAIQDVFINEVIIQQKVLYYLTLFVKNEPDTVGETDKLVPLFSELKPELKCLEYLYTRNTDEFNYSKDLMRVIRRILKCNPPQGQQFSTKNLFIEFNHTTWTRTDKMFAMVKFKDKGAVVYQQAFILTIKVLGLVPPSNALPDDRRLDLSKGPDRTRSVIKVSAASSSLAKPKSPLPAEVKDDSKPSLFDNSTSSNPNSSLVEELKPTQPEPEKVQVSEPVLTSTTSRDENHDIPELNLTLPEDVEEDLDPCNGRPKNPESKVEEPSEMQVDSTCLPYQYLIERDIESSRIKCIQKSVGDAPSKSDEDGVTDPMVLQCLDMTDMVMKGLMFTLRQEENSVKIVKQTTKVEVDEVLENSEKVETKEGDPCLLNSSLLKLESMITNIDRSKTSSDMSKLYQSLAILVTEKNPDSFCDDPAQPSRFGLDPPEIPEFQQNLMQVEKPEEYEGLAMDDFEEPVTWKNVVNSENGEPNGNQKIQKSNGPKVISNEIIKSADLPQSWLSMLISNKKARIDAQNVQNDFASEPALEPEIEIPTEEETEMRTEIGEVPESENLPVPIPDEDTKSWPSSTRSEKGKRKGESLRCDRIVKRKKVNDEVDNCVSRRNPKRGVSETRPDYSLKRRRGSSEVQRSGREMSNTVDICKLIGDLSKGVRVIVNRLDPKTLRS